MDITRFCGTLDQRGYMHKPFRANGRLYATNGHVAVSMADDTSIDASSEVRENVVALFGKAAAVSYEWHTIPRTESKRACGVCRGSGHSTTCLDCDGEGEFQHGRHNYECQECNGHGVVAGTKRDEHCAACCGTGANAYDGTDVGNAHYANRYLKLIATQFPGAEIGVPEDPMAVAQWRAGDVIGLLMPMRKD